MNSLFFYNMSIAYNGSNFDMSIDYRVMEFVADFTNQMIEEFNDLIYIELGGLDE